MRWTTIGRESWARIERIDRSKLDEWAGHVAVAALLVLGILLSSCKVGGVDGRLGVGKTGAAPDTQATLGSTVAPPPEPAVTAPVTFDVAESAYREGHYGDATELFAAYVDRKPENEWGYYMLGLSAWKAGDLARAEQALTTALELDPTHLKSLVNLSRVLLDEGDAEAALERGNAALALDSTSSPAYRAIARAQAALGRTEDAEESYRAAIAADSDDAWSLNNLGVLLIESERPGDALGPLARAVEISPAVATFHNNLGMALELSGYFVEAADQYRLAVEADPQHAKAAANRSRIEGRSDRAGLPPVDLPSLGREFLDGLKSAPDSTGTPADTTQTWIGCS